MLAVNPERERVKEALAHGILNWFGLLNDIDLDAIEAARIPAPRESLAMPLRPDEPVGTDG